MSESFTDVASRLYERYEEFRENGLNHRRFKHADIQPLLAAYREDGFFQVEEAGYSFEGRVIQRVSAGTGSQKVLFWSQMHGDEATATMALFDIFRFLQSRNDGFDDFRQLILSNLSLHFVPMLNPDGAERFQRPTAQMIDMNRDALALQTPEATILKGLIFSLKPDFGFNLHDQNPRYTAGFSSRLATISFLATSYDYQLSVNETRLRSMQVIAGMNEVLQRIIPGQVGRFNDDHEPRAFGDNIQKWGTTLILVESGGYPGDREKQYIRRLNFVALLSALATIASGSYKHYDQTQYEQIPFNSRAVYDLLIRSATASYQGKKYRIDVGINREEVNDATATGYWDKGNIEEVGDLSIYHGLEELDAKGLEIIPGKEYPQLIDTLERLNQLDPISAFREGFLFFRFGEGIEKFLESKANPRCPVQVLATGEIVPEELPQVGGRPTFLLRDEERLRYAVVNGFVYDLNSKVVES